MSRSGWWWISFAEDRDDGEFLGVCIVEGKTVADAVARATALGINPPGAEAVGLPITKEARDRTPISWRDRVLTDQEREEWPWPS